MSANTVMNRGRAKVRALMTDACVIDRRTGQQTDRLTGAVTVSYGPPLYTGPCLIGQSGGGSASDVAEEPKVVISRTLSLPVDESAAVRAGDRATITACVNDTSLVGREFWVGSEMAKTYQTARRFPVNEVTS
jgi:hypothetical protein